jgi:hypothetical protein
MNFYILLFVFIFAIFNTSKAYEEVEIKTVKAFFVERPGGIAVSSKGEIYVSIHSLEKSKTKLVKINKNGAVSVFPNQKWSSEPTKYVPTVGISNIANILITKDDVLWILDMGSSMFSPKIISWDLNKNQLKQIIYIPSEALTSNSSMQDFTIDEKQQIIYIADSPNSITSFKDKESIPALIAINLKNGEIKRLLSGKAILRSQSLIKNEFSGNVASISIDPNNEWVYFSGKEESFIYRIKSSELGNFNSSENHLLRSIEKYSSKPVSGNFKVAENGNIYIGNVAKSEIGIINKEGYKPYINNKSLKWVDEFFISQNDGFVYAIINQLDKHPNFNKGSEKSKKPYLIIKFKTIN